VLFRSLIRKNSILLGALKILSRSQALLLHNHDLAEDFRPDVYTGEEYPENCHYGVINSRDYSFLLEAGLKPEGLHLLPNEVRARNAAPGLEKTRYLYPVRGIRRKNLGEFLLLSLFIPKGRTVAITQPPTTERNAKRYNHWKALAEELSLPVEFECGEGRSFSEVLGTAFCVITTSIKEGFGFSFLEPWTAGLAVTGRRIDYVCRDFEKEGVRFDAFYDSIAIPSGLIPHGTFLEGTERALKAVYRSFGMEVPSVILEKLRDRILHSDFFDFGSMDEELQESLIRDMARNKTTACPFLANLADWEPNPALVEANMQAVLAAYSRESTAARLREACRGAASNPVSQSISRSKLLELYLDPARLSLIGIDYA
jgi:hypothetical protein